MSPHHGPQIPSNTQVKRGGRQRASAGIAWAHGQVFGRDGYLLSGGRGAMHEARETRESVFFISFAAAKGGRDLAEALAELSELP